MKAPMKPGGIFAKQYGTVERGNRTAQPPDDKPPVRPKANPKRGMTTSPRPMSRSSKTK